MDKALKHKQMVSDLAHEVAEMSEKVDKPIEVLRVFDEERGQFLLYFDGWKGERRFYGCFFHIDVQPDGKIWVRHDGTELDLTQMLIDRDVARQDIVLGFQSPPARRLIAEDQGFAIA